MGQSKAKREQAKVRELARKYKREGFEVLVEPDISVLPKSLQRFKYRPDLVVKRGDENLVIEVKTSATVSSVREFELFADALKDNPTWDSVFVLTNPKEIEDRNVADLAPSYEAASNLLRQAKRLADVRYKQEFADALMLITSATIEAVLRNALAGFRKHRAKKRADVDSLPRDAIIYGLIGEKTARKYEEIIEKSKYVVFGKAPTHDFVAINDKLFSDLETLMDKGVLSADFDEGDTFDLT